eukprot:TRINITY_DN11019_c1_g1_i1.p1 TRINITY_DN11019_c1_g1~~TRINITY_DN11019_c1_g1_i1.p1  ORF type:complete len:538 (+),score=126.06 TRINITY_DN11019_c1_g1_i1:78-1616(+)
MREVSKYPSFIPFYARKSFLVLLIVLLLLSILCITLFAVLITQDYKNTHVEPQYGVVIDAGSSGSRAHLYSWDSSSKTFPEVLEDTQVQELAACLRVRPGISSFVSHLDDIDSYIGDLCACLNDVIPSEAKDHAVPVSFLATAGMRQLSEADQARVYESVTNAFGKHLSNYFTLTRAETIRGIDEGEYGWVSVNYLQHGYTSGDPHRTFGALDMGGVSLQITFSPENVSEIPSDYRIEEKIGDAMYDVYGKSYMHFGRDAMDANVMEKLARGKPNNTLVYHPCYLKENNFQFLSTDSGNMYTMSGEGNSTACMELLRSMLNLTATCVYPHCGFDGSYQPLLPQSMQFSGFSLYGSVAEFFNITGKCSPNKMLSVTNDFCNKLWPDVEKEHPDFGPWLNQYCFDGVYIHAVLCDGFGFEGDDDRIAFSTNIDDTSLSWALGAMLLHARKYPPHDDSTTHPKHSEVLLASGIAFFSLLIAIILLTCLLYFVTRRRLPSKLHRELDGETHRLLHG